MPSATTRYTSFLRVKKVFYIQNLLTAGFAGKQLELCDSFMKIIPHAATASAKLQAQRLIGC